MGVPTCPICTSRKWRKAAGTGELICSEGHVLQGYRNETIEITEMGAHTVHRRQLRTGRRRKGQTEGENPDVYHGPRARYFYYQCRQLVLRHQIDKLVSEWELPKEAKNICRTIWLLSLEILPNKPPPQPWIHAQAEPESLSPSKQAEEQTTDNTGPPKVSQPDNTDALSNSESSDDDDVEDAMDEQIERQIEKLMYEASETESDSGSKGQSSLKRQKDQNRDARHNLYDSTAMNISMLVLTCWWLRVPAIYHDFIDLINSYRVPYLDVIPLLPPNMRKHLSVDLRQRLNPSHAPTVTALHVITRRIARRLLTAHGISIPEFNAAPVLWRAVRTFQGPPLLYSMAKRLMERLEVPLTVHPSLAPKPSLGIMGYGGDWAPVEVTMVAALIVILKMVYGFQEGLRVVPEEGDPALHFPDFVNYMSALRREAANMRMDFRCLVSRNNVITADALGNDEIDKYLETAERALRMSSAGNAKSTPFKKLIEIYGDVQEHSRQTPIIVNSTSDAIPPEALQRPALGRDIQDQPAKLPGESMITWSSNDPIGAFPPDYELLLTMGSNWSGVELLTINRLVTLFEKRLLRYTRRGRRPDASDTDMDMENIDVDHASTRSGSEEAPNRNSEPEGEDDGSEAKISTRGYRLGSQNWREHVHHRLSKGGRSVGAYKQISSSEEFEPESEDQGSQSDSKG
ncbi:hypothetical protein RhiJN_19092 [Ceratobasidium sp. AG-Ba]|nr:hypothetical protein RhiJN_04270 [Ceratobasidium sp. AG-Ba]QRV91074.1 hypothetical protein RhiJN_19092 [Ceratobasidium sp. AG-Ba]QRW05162.1 hypothetical protein RhiLY_04161 [Ceratobasidium sp. AG-Ba]